MKRKDIDVTRKHTQQNERKKRKINILSLSRFYSELPVEIMSKVFEFFSTRELLKYKLISKYTQFIVKSIISQYNRGNFQARFHETSFFREVSIKMKDFSKFIDVRYKYTNYEDLINKKDKDLENYLNPQNNDLNTSQNYEDNLFTFLNSPIFDLAFAVEKHEKYAQLINNHQKIIYKISSKVELIEFFYQHRFIKSLSKFKVELICDNDDFANFIIATFNSFQSNFKNIKNFFDNDLFVTLELPQSKEKLTSILTLLLTHTPNLISLDLQNCDLNDQDMIVISPLVATHKKIKNLYLDKNLLSNQGIIILSKFLKTHPSLELLDIYENNIDVRGSTAIANIISKNKLKEFYIGKNFIRDDSLKIANALKNNNSLKFIDFNKNNDMWFNSTELLNNIINNNKTLNYIYLDKIHFEDDEIINLARIKAFIELDQQRVIEIIVNEDLEENLNYYYRDILLDLHFSHEDFLKRVKEKDLKGVKSLLDLVGYLPVNARSQIIEEEGICHHNTALHIACQQGNLPMVELLLTHGANTKILNYEKKTPLALASEDFKHQLRLKIDMAKNIHNNLQLST